MSNRAAAKVAVIQDLSGVGRCALTVAIPVLAAMNAQPCPLPTAVLSANTAYPDIEHEDLSAFLQRATAHWESADMRFDALMSGYFSSVGQAQTVSRFADALRKRPGFLQLTDPAMADHGRLYRGLPSDMPKAMQALCSCADVITPNVTEAAMLLGRPQMDGPFTGDMLFEWLEALLTLGCGCAMITSAPMENGRMANACMRRGETGMRMCAFEPLPASYHGTGDLFAASLMGHLLLGREADEAMAFASGFVYAAIERTIRLGTPEREGVEFEGLLTRIESIPPMPLMDGSTQGT